MDVDLLRTAQVTVLGLSTTTTTTTTPPLIAEATIFRLAAGHTVAGPLSYWVDPGVSPLHVRPQSRPHLWLAPRWPEIAERITELIGTQVLAVLDRTRLDTLRRHLPDWQPPAVIFARELADHMHPELPGTLRDALHHAPTNGATEEAHAVMQTLHALLGQPHPASPTPAPRTGPAP